MLALPDACLPTHGSQKAFKDFIGALVLHKSSVSGMYYRDDPTIMGWELANNPVCPGDDSGDVVQVSPGAAARWAGGLAGSLAGRTLPEV